MFQCIFKQLKQFLEIDSWTLKFPKLSRAKLWRQIRLMHWRIREIILQFLSRLSDTVTLLQPIMNDISRFLQVLSNIRAPRVFPSFYAISHILYIYKLFHFFVVCFLLLLIFIFVRALRDWLRCKIFIIVKSQDLKNSFYFWFILWL